MCVCVQETGGEGGELWQGRPTRAWARGSAGPQSLSELEAGECTAPNGDRHFGPLHGGRSAQPDMSKRSRRCLPGERPSKGGGGGAGQGSPGSGQMVKNHPRFLLGEKGSQIAHLVQGHTVAPWQGWARGSGAGIEGTLWEPGIQGESPQTHRIPKLRSWFSEATRAEPASGCDGGPAPSWSYRRLGSL